MLTRHFDGTCVAVSLLLHHMRRRLTRGARATRGVRARPGRLETPLVKLVRRTVFIVSTPSLISFHCSGQGQQRPRRSRRSLPRWKLRMDFGVSRGLFCRSPSLTYPCCPIRFYLAAYEYPYDSHAKPLGFVHIANGVNYSSDKNQATPVVRNHNADHHFEIFADPAKSGLTCRALAFSNTGGSYNALIDSSVQNVCV